MHDQALQASRMKLAEFVRRLWCVTVPEGTEREKLLQPSFWSHVCAQFEEGTINLIEVTDDPGTFWALLWVREAGKTWASVEELMFKELQQKTSQSVEIAGFRVEYKGPHLKHVVIRESDDEVVAEGISKKAEAWKWAAENQAKVA